MKTVMIFAALMCAVLMVACTENNLPTRAEAEERAMKALQEYAKKEMIPISSFKPSERESNYYDKDVRVWVIYYETQGISPRQRVNILVDHYNNAEIHRLKE